MLPRKAKVRQHLRFEDWIPSLDALYFN